MGPRLSDYLTFFLGLVDGGRTRAELAIAADRDRVLETHFPTGHRLRVLDLGCGRLRPQYEILRSRGHFVVGVDLVNGRGRGWEASAYRLARRLYRVHLRQDIRFAATGGLVCSDAARLPFRSESFDLVTSVAAFEHFLDVPKVVCEMNRLLRPGGVFFAGIHLFTAPSGGHNVELMGPPIESLPAGVDPWDHLRERRLPFHVPLNEWRSEQYLDEFETYFEILEVYCAEREGEQLLTEELEKKLLIYTRDELTCKSLHVYGRKPVGFWPDPLKR